MAVSMPRTNLSIKADEPLLLLQELTEVLSRSAGENGDGFSS